MIYDQELHRIGYAFYSFLAFGLHPGSFYESLIKKEAEDENFCALAHPVLKQHIEYYKEFSKNLPDSISGKENFDKIIKNNGMSNDDVLKLYFLKILEDEEDDDILTFLKDIKKQRNI